jgi:translation initiation factor 2 beta subunit (eIF-2beta)/eIF-5
MSNINNNINNVNNNNNKFSLPQSHKSIKEKFTIPEIDLNSECELILFELPKNFNKELIKDFKINSLKRNGKKIKLINNYKGLCYDNTNQETKQSLCLINDKKQNKLIFKPIDRYIKVYEALEFTEPEEKSIIKRELKEKKENKENKIKERGKIKSEKKQK